ncbi:MAG TPA: cytochrome c biogenesis protein [Candidatus Polarisedimenticolia bacterium]|nr:cytochrome c biogenesis protein [Candidatus Polarisedimenticolia bacterium]
MMRAMLERLLLLAATLLVPAALQMAFVVAPTEGKMGVVQRIFYFHVPSAMMAFLGVGLCAAFSALYLYGRRRIVDIMAETSAELAFLFCTIVLITGPIWARPVWGVWWTGEVRLTSTLVLWLILIGYLLLRKSAEDREQAARWGAIAAIVGALDVPIIYKSVEWWRGLHPKVLKVSGGGGLDPVMGKALAVSTVAFLALFAVLFMTRVRIGRLEDEIESVAGILDRRAATGPARAGGGAS